MIGRDVFVIDAKVLSRLNDVANVICDVVVVQRPTNVTDAGACRLVNNGLDPSRQACRDRTVESDIPLSPVPRR